jgi:hypothetical protein
MNRRLKDKLGEYIAEQRGWHWALTSFAREAWGETKKDIELKTNFLLALLKLLLLKRNSIRTRRILVQKNLK